MNFLSQRSIAGTLIESLGVLSRWAFSTLSDIFIANLSAANSCILPFQNLIDEKQDISIILVVSY